MLATHSPLPIVEGFTRAAGVSLSTADISWPVAYWPPSPAEDDLAVWGADVLPRATIINCSIFASCFQSVAIATADTGPAGMSC